MEIVTTNNNTEHKVRQPSNTDTFDMLKQLGYKEPEIRHAIAALNRLSLPTISKRVGISKQTMYKVIDGKSGNLDAIREYSTAVRIPAPKAFADILKFDEG